MPKVSIICPTKNCERYIRYTLKSVQKQTFQDWELLVMDGMSLDDTEMIVRAYMIDDPRIKIYVQEDESNWEAVERGVALARGEYLFIIAGQDGFLDPTWLAQAVAKLDSDPSLGLVHAATRGMNDDGTLQAEQHITYSHLQGKDPSFLLPRKVYAIMYGLLFVGKYSGTAKQTDLNQTSLTSTRQPS